MRKIMIVLTAMGFMALVAGASFAAPQSGAGLKKTIAGKKARLDGAVWTVRMKPMGRKGRAKTDVISFAEGKVSSKNLSSLGYGPSNFTVRLEDDGTLIWETMQVSAKDGKAFWRGDIKDGIMRGVLSRRDAKNNAYDFNFAGTGE